ncbi:MAG: nucleoside deaminase, partial [Clostridia bacterium]|nr:nucleoside deaminase [Clostridia bacterium]
LGGWRLSGCTMYVTLEPCTMCAGAIVSAKLDRVVVGAKDPKAGAMGSVISVNSYPLNHKPRVEYGLCREECSAILTEFFSRRREENKQKRGSVSKSRQTK